MAGALRSPDDPDDFIFERIAQAPEGYYIAELPIVFDLRKMSPAPRSQGNRGTCAAFAGASIKEIQEREDCGFEEYMSPEFIYYHRENKPGVGMYGRNVFQILQRIGSVPESVYPYCNDEDAPPPDEDLYKIAAQYRIANFARITTIDGLKKALIEYGPCYLQLPLYTNRPRFWIPAEVGEQPVGGHAVAVVGYNERGFILRNSWGEDWNGNGCIIFPYSEWSIHWECWCGVDEKTQSPEFVKKRGRRGCSIV